MNLAPLDATFGATVTDINLTDLDDGQFQVLYNTWLQYSLLIFPAQHLDSELVVVHITRISNTFTRFIVDQCYTRTAAG